LTLSLGGEKAFFAFERTSNKGLLSLAVHRDNRHSPGSKKRQITLKKSNASLVVYSPQQLTTFHLAKLTWF